MTGRAEKGIILTTGPYTHEAIKEANRDGEKLITMFEKVELGLIPKTI